MAEYEAHKRCDFHVAKRKRKRKNIAFFALDRPKIIVEKW
ncbi:hypothetical protein HMPREF1870_01565 [Bacteroidales bacterium KA00344]|nr:hypothetical protein HMPREF1870_01565 [Bacteroidales bacterium KA00344]